MPRQGRDLAIPNKSFPDHVLNNCLKHGDAIALEDNSRQMCLTYNDLYKQSRTCAGYLHHIGIRKQDYVVVCVPSSPEYVVAFFGIMTSGAVAVPVNPGYKQGEFEHQFNVSEPKAAFVHESAIETMRKVQTSFPCLEHIIVIGDAEDFTTLETVLKGEYDLSFLDELEINPREDIALIPRSSGTTGLPKAVLLTHENMVAQEMIAYTMVTCYSDQGCFYSDRPMYHLSGYGLLSSCLIAGIKWLIGSRFEMETVLKAIEKHKVTHMLAVPPNLIELANSEEVVSKYDVSSVSQIFCGGAPVSSEVLCKIQSYFGAKVLQTYAMTEAGAVSINYTSDPKFFDSVGVVTAGSDIKIVGLESRQEVKDGENGEILIRGPQVVNGYLKNSEATKNAFDEDGWFRSGDIGNFKSNGMLYVIDRLKEIIQYKIYQISPAELEAGIIKHPKVADVGVVGIPDPEAGEVPKAFVVKNDDSLTEKDVLDHVENEFIDRKRLRGGVEFVSSIPKSILGKIQRKELKKMAGL